MYYNNKFLHSPAGKINKKLLNQIKIDIKTFINSNQDNIGILARHKPHLLIPSIFNLSLDEEIKKNVDNFLGEKSVMWFSVFFIKKKRSQQYIPWHYDQYYWSYKLKKGCTLWLAINDIEENMGPMEFAFEEVDTNIKQEISNDPHNILARGNSSIYQPKSETKTGKVILKEGEYSLHNNYAWHRSGTNDSNLDRLGLALRYVTLDVEPKTYKFIKRGCVGKGFNENYFYEEKCPKKLTKPLKNIYHFKSVIIFTFLSFFSDDKRNFYEKITDLFKFIKSKKFLNKY